MVAHAHARVAGFKAPKGVDFIDALPRNASGRCSAASSAPYRAGRERQVD